MLFISLFGLRKWFRSKSLLTMGWHFGRVNNNIFQSSVMSSSSFDSCTKWVGSDSKGQRHKLSHACRLKMFKVFPK
jgi:hypothetical protein